MTTTPLPEPAIPHSRLVTSKGVFGALYTADQLHAHAAAVTADLHAEIATLRAAAEQALEALKHIANDDWPGADLNAAEYAQAYINTTALKGMK
jgi:hypothetical protein